METEPYVVRLLNTAHEYINAHPNPRVTRYDGNYWVREALPKDISPGMMLTPAYALEYGGTQREMTAVAPEGMIPDSWTVTHSFRSGELNYFFLTRDRSERSATTPLAHLIINTIETGKISAIELAFGDYCLNWMEPYTSPPRQAPPPIDH